MLNVHADKTLTHCYYIIAPNVALRSIPTQSSTQSYYGSAQNAKDGSLANNYLRSQCSYTNKEDGPWWMVDLNKPHKIMSVAITNRVLECCRERIFGAEIRIGNNPEKGGTSNPRCGVISSIESGEKLSFSCQGMTGRYVTITIPGRAEHLVLCEVQVFGFPASSEDEVTVPEVLKTPNGAVNVAVKGVAQQSSLYNMYGEAKNGIDGSLDSNYLHIQCSGTAVQHNPWWRVDLMGKFKVFTVAVTNRGDCCVDRIIGAQIRIGNSAEDGGTNNPICGTISTMERAETLAFECDGMVGQYVTVFLPGENQTLTICEVQVFGLPSDVSVEDLWDLFDDDDGGDYSDYFIGATETKEDEVIGPKETTEDEGENLAFRGISSQSSTYDKFGAAENAVDGSTKTNYMSQHCSHTDLDVEPWWRVDLTRVYNVTKVKILNRGDCCSERIAGAEIRIGTSPERGGSRNPKCAKMTSLGLGKEQEYVCGMAGQYVTVTIPGRAGYLTLCEVKVYGKDLPDNYTAIPLYIDPSETTGHEDAKELRNILKHSSAAPNVALSGEASQSSTDGGDSSKASDGILSSCARTEEESNPWWTLDLKSIHKVFFIAVTSRKDSEPTSLDGAEIHIGNSATGWRKNPVCGTVSSIGPGETFSFNCDGMEGRYVTIVIPDQVKRIDLCEVQVFGLSVDTPSNEWNGNLELQKEHHGVKNVAPQGFASQSSHYSSKDDAKRAIDGSLQSNYMRQECTHTALQRNPWWRVDLKSTHRVQSVAITNRGDCCREYINGAEIRVGNSKEDGGVGNPRCETVFKMYYGETMSFNCKGMEGRYVTIHLPNQTHYLNLCEVQVFGEPVAQEVKNVAPQGFASQSSHYSSKDDAKRAIDGSLQSNYMRQECTHTALQRNPWWRVDLKSTHRVQSVAITNRGDCCREYINGAEIRVGNSKEDGGVGNPRCETVFKMYYGETMSFNCKGMEGRYVTIHLPNQTHYLNLCEVQVFGEPVAQEVVLDLQQTSASMFVKLRDLHINYEDGKLSCVSHEFLELTISLSPSFQAVKDLTGKYFLFPKESNNSYIDLTPALPLILNAFSLCMKVSLDVPKHRETILFSYRSLYYDELNLWLEATGKLGFYMSGEGLMLAKLDRRKEWQHICLTWESKFGRCELWVNGRRSANSVYRKRHTVRPGGIAMLGQDQDALGHSFDVSQSFVGRIKDLNMWSRVLSIRSLRSVFRGKEKSKGNVFAWSELTFAKKGEVRIVDSA
ncbi:PREDICTED: uncharacterized protein LOC108793438 [Nanorana parkeri]|uniref:uncharacterized protein LOC108793438 n=1 Tax=Nanorana parkeri TaxID=125878 RepID=UPI00085421BF|nr:PREDICTED: uncharacterized protein LOC108793438 [Nanorana parkeri]